jgi:hypothetical protein
MPDTEVSVKAHFKQTTVSSYRLDVSANNDTYGRVEVSTSESLYGIEVHLLAIPNEGYTFSYWNVISPHNLPSVGWRFSATGAFRMPEADVELVAIFQPK